MKSYTVTEEDDGGVTVTWGGGWDNRATLDPASSLGANLLTLLRWVEGGDR